MDLDFQGRYVMTPNWAMKAGVVNSQAQSKTGVLKRNNTSLNKIYAGGQYFTFMNGLEIVPEFLFSTSLDAPSTDSDFVPNNEGVMELIGLTRLQKMWNKYSLFGHMGLNYRGGGRSTLLLWGGGAEGYAGSFTYGAEILGFLSMIADKDAGKLNTSLDDRTAYLNRVAGGSKKFYSYDPSLVDLQAYSFYHITKMMALGLNLGTSLMGTSIAAGFHGGLNFQFNFDWSDPRDIYATSSSENKSWAPRKSSKKEKSVFRFRPVERSAPVKQEPPRARPYSNSNIQFQEDIDPASAQKLSTDNVDQFKGESESTVDQSMFGADSDAAVESSPAPGSVRRMRPQQDGPVSRREMEPETNRKRQSRPSIYDPPVEAATQPGYRKPDPLRDVKDPRIVPSSEIPKQPRFAPRRARPQSEKFEYSNRPLPEVAPSNKRINSRTRSRTNIPAFEEDQSVKNQLDATEMQIELKQSTTKKKKSKKKK